MPIKTLRDNWVRYIETWQLRLSLIIIWGSKLWPYGSYPATQFLPPRCISIVPQYKTCPIATSLQKTGDQYCLQSPASRWTCLLKCTSAWQFRSNLRFSKLNNRGVLLKKKEKTLKILCDLARKQDYRSVQLQNRRGGGALYEWPWHCYVIIYWVLQIYVVIPVRVGIFCFKAKALKQRLKPWNKLSCWASSLKKSHQWYFKII